MILVEDVRTVLGGVPVLDGITLRIEREEILVLVGPSGAGKSVLLKHIIGLLNPDRGTVRVDGADVGGATYRQLAAIRRRMGYVFQDAALLDWLTVGENLRLALDDRTVAADPAAAERRIAESAARVNFPVSALEKRPAELSGGMRKRAGVARAIVHAPEIILYDEPTTGLDPANVAAINDVVVRVRETLGVTSLVVTHDMDSVARIADRVALLDEGRIAFLGTPAEFFAAANPIVAAFLAGDCARSPEPAAVEATASGTSRRIDPS